MPRSAAALTLSFAIALTGAPALAAPLPEPTARDQAAAALALFTLDRPAALPRDGAVPAPFAETGARHLPPRATPRARVLRPGSTATSRTLNGFGGFERIDR